MNKYIFFLLTLILFSFCNIKENTVLQNRKISYKGGSGTSIQDAVIIYHAKSLKSLIKAEDLYLQKYCKLKHQSVLIEKQYLINKKIEIVTLKDIKKDSLFNVYFNLSYLNF